MDDFTPRSAIDPKDQAVLRLAGKVRADLVKILSAIRKLHLVLADGFVERGWLEHRDHYFLIRLEEIEAVIKGQSAPEKLRVLSAERLEETARHRTVQMPRASFCRKALQCRET